MNDIISTITKPLAVLGENGSGYTKEANFVSWNGNDAKLDIRIWYLGHERCGKGITLTDATFSIGSQWRISAYLYIRLIRSFVSKSTTS